MPAVNIKENRGLQKFFIKKVRRAEHRLPEKVMKLRYKSKLPELLAVDAGEEEKGIKGNNVVAARVFCMELKKKTEISTEGPRCKRSSREDLRPQAPSSGGLDA